MASEDENNRNSESDDGKNSEALLKELYSELRQLAARRLAHEKPGQTLTATALVHEVFLKLSGNEKWDSPAHFFGAAAEAMRRIMIDNARRKATLRRGGDYKRIDMNTAEVSVDMDPRYANSILELSECLDDFAASYPNEAMIVNLRFFAGLTMEEIAEILGITRRTAQRHWAFARGALGHLMSAE